jgi:hypothetical protein
MVYWISVVLLAALQNPAPSQCLWGPPVESGTLPAMVNESSGMAISRRIPDRSYRINDSGDTGRFFALDLAGGNAKAVGVAGFRPVDSEDIALGPCGDAADCIFIGDIGDNARARRNLEIVVVEETVSFPAEVEPRHRVRIQYPDGPRDAEALGVHPDGSLYILSKEPIRARLYRLTRAQWMNPQNPVETMELVAELDMARLLPVSTVIDRPVTSMDFSADGRRLIILTYRNALELFVDFGGRNPDPGSWREGEHYRTVTLEVLEQQEAIAYLPNGTGFLYDTERPLPSRPARIMRVSCPQ